MKRALVLLCLGLSTTLVARGQTPLDPAMLTRPGTGTWPMYNGDYSGRRFSTLKQINASNVGALSLAWVYRLDGHGGSFNGVSLKGTPLQINGVLYLTEPDHAWAVDARTGREIWHYAWESKGGIHLGNRGAGDLRRHAVLRDAGLPSRRARHQGRHRALEQDDLRSRSVLLRVGGARGHQEPS